MATAPEHPLVRSQPVPTEAQSAQVADQSPEPEVKKAIPQTRKLAEAERRARIQRNEVRKQDLERLAVARREFSEVAEALGGPKTRDPKYPQAGASQLVYAVDRYVRGEITQADLKDQAARLVRQSTLADESLSLADVLSRAAEGLETQTEHLLKFWKERARKKRIDPPGVNLAYYDPDVVSGAVDLIEKASEQNWSPLESEDFGEILHELRVRRDAGGAVSKSILGCPGEMARLSR